MSVTAIYDLKLLVEEVLSVSQDLADDPQLDHEPSTAIAGILTASTKTPASKVWSDTRSLVAGADTFDLTSLTGPNGTSIDFTGLKVCLIFIAADKDNTEPIKFDVGAANGYNLFGAATSEISLDANTGDYGAGVLMFCPETLPDVAAGAKNIDVTSAEADGSYSIILVAG
jgi:hypothetical protein